MHDFSINSLQQRLDDLQSFSHERSERFFTMSGLWYFRTREGKDVGPFRYRSEAETMLHRFKAETERLQQESMMSTKPHFRTFGIIGNREAN